MIKFALKEKERKIPKRYPYKQTALKAKIASKFQKEELKNLALSSKEELKSFLQDIEAKKYKELPVVLKIAELSKDLKELLNTDNQAVFLTRARAAHIAEARKAKYNQALSLEEKLKMPQIISEAKGYYKDEKKGILIPFKDEINTEKINLIILDKDSKGNFLITAKKIDEKEFKSGKYQWMSRAGVEPATTTPKTEQKPTEAISLDKTNSNKENLNLDYESLKAQKEKIKEKQTDKAITKEAKEVFTDLKGKEHIISQETAKLWKETFNLNHIDEPYKTNLSDEIKELLDGKNITLKKGSLKKLIAQKREHLIPFIREVLEKPEAILKDNDNAFLFIKHLKDNDYFVNVSVDKGESLISISNGIKEKNNLLNKLKAEAKIIYVSPNANSNLQTLLQTSLYSANKIQEASLNQTPLKNTENTENGLPRSFTTSRKDDFTDTTTTRPVIAKFDISN